MSDQELYILQHYEQNPRLREIKSDLDDEVRERIGPRKWEGYHKIGISNRIRSRLSRLQSGTPHDLRLLATIDVDGDTQDIERAIHKELRSCNVRGEWFDLHPDIVEWFVNRNRLSKSGLEDFKQYRQNVYLEDE